MYSKKRKESVSLGLEQNWLPICTARTSYSHRDSFIYPDRIIAMFTKLKYALGSVLGIIY